MLNEPIIYHPSDLEDWPQGKPLPRPFRLCLHPKLAEFQKSNTLFHVLDCSRRAGKGVAANLKAITGFAAAPGKGSWQCLYTQAVQGNVKRTALQAIKVMLDAMMIPYVENKADATLRNPETNALIVFGGIDRSPHMARGTRWNLVVADEAAFVKEIAFQEFITSVVPAVQDANGQIIIMSTHEGYGHFYEWQQKGLDPRYPNVSITQVTADEMKTMYPEDVAIMKESMTETERLQELYCTASQPTASIYHKFNTSHIVESPMTSGALYLSMDFNVVPHSHAVVLQAHQNHIFVHDEICNGRIQEDILPEFMRRYPVYRHPTIILSGDVHGLRQYNSESTYYDDAERVLTAKGYAVSQMFSQRSNNPLVKTSYKAINDLFATNQILINPRCEKTIRDLKEMRILSNSQKHPSHLSHASDAMRYAIFSMITRNHIRPLDPVLPGFSDERPFHATTPAIF